MGISLSAVLQFVCECFIGAVIGVGSVLVAGEILNQLTADRRRRRAHQRLREVRRRVQGRDIQD